MDGFDTEEHEKDIKEKTVETRRSKSEWQRGVKQWWFKQWRSLVSELVSTSMLMGLGCASVLRKPNASQEPAPLMHPAMSFGFIVTALSVAFGVPSGAHMNPAVTCAAVLMKRISPVHALAFTVTQVMGATLGYWLLAQLAPAARVIPAGMTLPGDEISELGALLLEVAMTGLLILTICALWISPPDPTGPIIVGFLVAGLTLCGGWISGTSLNPARSIGPAIYHNHWDHHWIYWVGPVGGAVAGVGLHLVLHPATAPWRCLRSATPPPPPTQAGPEPTDPSVDENLTDKKGDRLPLRNKEPTPYGRLPAQDENQPMLRY